ncbi:hypothetical protein BC835DRAFT_1351956 [Cytidiella melzeri]|nr:hypothetical protein BC835DRAFT_1351956 [Cytidiella melzeri]
MLDWHSRAGRDSRSRTVYPFRRLCTPVPPVSPYTTLHGVGSRMLDRHSRAVRDSRFARFVLFRTFVCTESWAWRIVVASGHVFLSGVTFLISMLLLKFSHTVPTFIVAYVFYALSQCVTPAPQVEIIRSIIPDPQYFATGFAIEESVGSTPASAAGPGCASSTGNRRRERRIVEG